MKKLSAYYDSEAQLGNKSLTPLRDDIAPSDYLNKKMQVKIGFTVLRSSPNSNAEPLSQILYGEGFNVLSENDGWAWGQCQHDNYVGYVTTSALTPQSQAPTHRVKNLTTNIYVEPNGKSQIIENIPFNSTLAINKHENNTAFAKTEFGWVPIGHIEQITAKQNYIEVAEMFLGCPYLWGGRNLLGIDCSGLVQAALNANGIKAPRDTGMQLKALGARPYNNEPLTRGDIIFFPGHVGIMADATNLIHSNAFHMQCVAEPLSNVVDRPTGDNANTITGIALAKTFLY